MISSQNQKKIIIILFILSIIILAANLIYSKLYKSESRKISKDSIEISSVETEELFKIALSNLGIKNDWIKKRKNKNSSDLHSFFVNVPVDLPITVVLSEINNVFEKDEAKVISSEKKINGTTSLKIFSGGKLKLISHLNYNSDIHRNAGNIGIIISDFWNLNDKKINDVLNVPEIFTVLLVPSKKSLEIIKILDEHNKNYSVLLNDDITELEFKLSEDYSQSRLLLSVRTIIGKFSQTDFFVVDNSSNLYSSSIYPFIEEEFKKRNIKLFMEDSLFNISEESEINARKKFREKIKITKEEDQAVVILSAEQLLNFQNDISDFRKVGYKFINPIKIIKSE